MEAFFIEAIKEYGYIILFLWSTLEGETGLVMAGVMCHTGDMTLFWAITVAALGGFVGDQVYFYIGRLNKRYIHKELHEHRRKFALAHLLLKKYGWPLIFVQRYMYGMRTIIPMAIGLTRYDWKMFALVNLLSAFVWAALTIILAYIYGEEILSVVHWFKDKWMYVIPSGMLVAYLTYRYFHHATQKKVKP